MPTKLDAKGRPLVRRQTAEATCARCQQRYPVRLKVAREYRPSLGRVCYFHQRADRSMYCPRCLPLV